MRLLLLICQAVCLWLAAAKLHVKDSDYKAHGLEKDNADNNQLQQMDVEQRQRLLLPAVQVKVTNEVESAMRMMMMMTKMETGQTSNHFDTQMANHGLPLLLSLSNLMRPRPSFSFSSSSDSSSSLLPILDGHNSAIRAGSGTEEQLLRLQSDYNYKLLYDAERHTYFQLHTITGNQDAGAQPNRRLFQQTVGSTLSAAFGLNVPMPMDGRGTVTTETVHLYDAASLRQSRFNPFNPTRILIHGWLGNANANMYSALLPPYLSLDQGRYNIFTVDWGRGAIADYITASYRVRPVGQVLAKFVDFLHLEAGLRFEDLQLVGFSMGAHVAGLAGKHLQTGRLRMIRALDPALPFFRYAQEKERLARDDADYVEVLHTSVGSYGFDRPLGHVDFYANWGSQQPGCFWRECSHWRAFILFAESLRPGRAFASRGCAVSEWQQLTRFQRCRPRETTQTEPDQRVSMGGDLANASMDQLLATRQGVYYFATNDRSPYGMSGTK
ncbi:blast:Lipoprotein lipase [Drosophila guanche]|uniref:Blast:Lipoprotein lipase n=1 Tax=Drosophila guanche TaxID=7266 RepID=A0A3B0KIJ5_DROGU|nr:blast:Lipoprotein lipase [Drosophila guanche]